jgi:septal ring factor EnvC (AmiA/AmiB activator)
MIHFHRSIQYLVIITITTLTLPAYSEHLNDAINTETATNKAAIQSQKKIDGLSDKTREMLDKYRSTTYQIKTLTTYNDHLKELLSSQKEEKESFQQQLKQIEVTQREIVPLIIRMLDSLDKFVSLDLPFLPEERNERVAKLKEMISRADVSNAEKFRRILEAYQIENDYGNTIEAYQSDLNVKGNVSSVDFLRLGRVALYYQRFDGSETGYWDRETNQWQILSENYRNAIRNGLRIARKETAPDLLSLPVPAAEPSR